MPRIVILPHQIKGSQRSQRRRPNALDGRETKPKLPGRMSKTTPIPNHTQPGRAFMTREVDEDQSKEWYLDSCVSRHICNNRERFADRWPKSYEFVTARGTIIRSSQVGTIILPIENGLQLTLSNVAFTPECDSNLISLG